MARRRDPRGERARSRLSGTRLLQIGILFLLLVSVAQVLWWYIDQQLYTASVRQRLLTHYRSDVATAQQALDAGGSESAVARAFPQLRIDHGRAAIAPHALEAIDAERARRLHRYRWEGGFFLAVLVICMTVLWRALREEASLRRRQQNFVASVSHEFKSPLASLQLGAETLNLRELPPERSREIVRRMLEDLQRMGDMVSKILDASRLDHGRIRLNPEPVDLASTVSLVLQSIEAGAQGAGVRFETRVPRDLEIRADPLAARAVLRNLLDNAVKATAAAGGGEVVVEAERTDGHVRLEVRDSGVGFRPEEATRLFEKFYRPGDELRRGNPGSGLGLYIVKRFMRLERGRVEAHSDGPGRGAVFRVSWPVARETA